MKFLSNFINFFKRSSERQCLLANKPKETNPAKRPFYEVGHAQDFKFSFNLFRMPDNLSDHALRRALAEPREPRRKYGGGRI